MLSYLNSVKDKFPKEGNEELSPSKEVVLFFYYFLLFYAENLVNFLKILELKKNSSTSLNLIK